MQFPARQKGGGIIKAHQTDFSGGSVGKSILDVALPLTAAELLNLLYNIVDRVYIGRIPGVGAEAFTGVGICFPIITFITAFSYLYGSGGAPLCAIECGRKNTDEAQRIMGTAFSMLLLTGLVLCAVGLALHRPILYLFGASDSTFPYAKDYITLYLLGSPFVTVTLGMNPFINSQGFGRVGMLTVLLGAGTNILLDPLFIFALDLGVRGAALATVLSQALSATWVVWFLTRGKSELRLHRHCLAVHWHRLRSIASLGLSGFVMGITNSLVQIVCNTTIYRYGGDVYVGSMALLNSVREVVTLPVSSLTGGASPVMSYSYGEGAYGRVKQAIRFISIWGIAFSLLTWLLIICFPSFFIGIFTKDAELVSVSIPAMRLYFFGFFMMALQFVGQRVFISLGKARRAVFFSLFRKVIIVVPLTILLPRLGGLGVNGVFLAEPVSNFIGGLACFVTMLLTVLPELGRGTSSAPKAS